MVTARIDLQNLQQELDGFQNKFEQWTRDTVAATENSKDEHVERLAELHNNIRELEQQQKSLEQRAQSVQQRLQAEDAEIDTLEAELTAIQEEQAALPAKLQAVKTTLDTETSEAEKRSATVKDQQQRKQRKLDALNEALDCYKDRLGLAFEHSHDDGECLNVILTQIDPSNPSRQFAFAVQVMEGDKYDVVSCEPQVPGLPELVNELNRTNDFSEFVRKLRKEFQALVKA